MANDPIRYTRGARAVADEVVQRLTTATAKHYAILMNEMKAEVVLEIDKIIRSEMITDRDGIRRKKGNRHLLGSFEANVESAPRGFPITLIVTTRGPIKKTAALEYGSPSHSIYPADGEGNYLYFPNNPGGNARGNAYRARRDVSKPKVGARGGTKATIQLTKLKRPVDHPGNRAYGFMRRGTQRVIDRHLH